MLINPQVGTSRGGAPYLRCLLRNAACQVAGRCWSFDASRLRILERAAVVEVDGEVVDWQGSPQVNIEQIAAVDVEPREIVALMPRSTYDTADMFSEVRSMLRGMACAECRVLAEAFLDDAPLMDRFCEAPAGVRKHHAWIGGLLEHTRSVMRLASAVLHTYEGSSVQVRGDEVLLAAFLHDLGKTMELDWTRGFSYTEEGEMVGHIVRGAMLIEEKAAELEMSGGPSIDPSRLRRLQHMVLSHHERREYGAAKEPLTPEAHVLCLVDRIDATLHLVD